MTDSPHATTIWPPDVLTLAMDVGGSGLKASVLDVNGQMIADRVRIETPYPCPPSLLVEKLGEIKDQLPDANRASVGFPGLVRSGRVLNIPSLSRLEYGGPRDDTMANMWHGYDLATALADAFNIPVKVANDADVQGCAVVEGKGFEFVMTLGTGCGTAVFHEGRLLPHMELSHAQSGHPSGDFDDYIGNAARKEIGNKRWRKRVVKAMQVFDEFLFYDRIYVGGGNAKKLSAADLGPKAKIVANTAGILGGIRIWEMDA
ncbi:MAG TPA: ROK family protein [Actinomycetota bacterium]|nr:ROK family protein [Actinomycetota bacterium]